MILDIHTHNKGANANSIINLSVEEYAEFNRSDRLYSIGLHPWHIGENTDKSIELLTKFAENKNVVAIGETGIDSLNGNAPLFQQLLIMKRHIEISERVAKPLIIHNVKAHDIIISLRKEFSPSMPWIIHGFRNKPSVAKMLINAGCYLSFGKFFNEESLISTPDNRILAETDDADIEINDVVCRLSDAYGKDIEQIILRNTAELFLQP